MIICILIIYPFAMLNMQRRRDDYDQPHLAQCYSRTRRIALFSCGAHESEIYFEVQPGVNEMVLSREKYSPRVEMFC